MIYATGGAFRMALEERLRREALSSGVPLARLRKTVAFDRILARLEESGQGVWVLKGGLALQIRFAARSRTTKDVDLHTGETVKRAITLLVAAAELAHHHPLLTGLQHGRQFDSLTVVDPFAV
jgi:hypothetical protein